MIGLGMQELLILGVLALFAVVGVVFLVFLFGRKK